MAKPDLMLRLAICFPVLFSSSCAKSASTVATSEADAAFTPADFEKDGFGSFQSELIAKVTSGKATARDSRRLQILEKIRNKDYASEFSTTSEWDSHLIKTDWLFDKHGDFLEATVAIPDGSLRQSDLPAVAYQAVSGHTPNLSGFYELLQSAIQSGRPQVSIIGGFVVSVSKETDSTVFVKVDSGED